MREAKTPPNRDRDSVANTLIVAVSLSLVCSVLVASAAVLLKPEQVANEQAYRRDIILDVAGLAGSGDPAARFEQIETRMVDLERGTFTTAVEVNAYDPLAAARDPELGTAIPAGEDVAGIRRRARAMPVHLVREDGRLAQVILPVYGAGLWSTMYGYLSVETDGRTIRALRFYEHAETPGLGDQIDRPAWLAAWRGKLLYDERGVQRIEVTRGPVPKDAADARFQVDGLAGATLTGRGVTNLVRYWTGPHGFGPFLDALQRGIPTDE